MITLVDQAINHAFNLFSQDQREKALEVLTRTLEKNPNHSRVVQGMGMMLLNMNRPDEAFPYLERSLELEPKNPIFLSNMGAYYTRMEEHEKSLEYLETAIQVKPDYTDALLNKAHVLSMLSRFDEAIETAMIAHRIIPQDEQLSMNLYTYLRDQDFERGFKFINEQREKYGNAHFWRVSCSDALYSDQVDEAWIDDLHRQLGEKVNQTVAPTKRYLGDRQPDRKIRVGILSTDLRRHSVSYFLLNWLKELDPAEFDVYLYSLMAIEDEISQQFEQVGTYRRLHAARVPTIVSTIYNDKIDILFELNGLTIGGRPDVMAARPAPVQVSAIGYAHGVGTDRIDYNLVDHVTDPEGYETHYVNKLLRLPGCFLCFGFLGDLPDVPQVTESRPVTFGSFNNHLKITPTTVELWASVLRAVPGSVMKLKALGLKHPPIQRAVMSWFEARGMADRVQIMEPPRDQADHQVLYQEIDISLDSFPYNGTTTTMESLLMGVPVLTLQGDAHRKRVSSSLLIHAGLEEWVATSPEQFVEIAKQKAEQVDELRKGRSALREKVAASPIMDSKTYAKNMSEALRGAWRAYCESNP